MSKSVIIRLVSLAAGAVAFAGTAAAAPGRSFAAAVSCASNSASLRITASAYAQPGYDSQWIAAQSWAYSLDTGQDSFTDWVVFKQDPPQRGGSDLAPSYAVVPGSTSYMWYTGTWVDLSNWSKTGSYEYARVGVGAFAGPYIQDS
jgi:hypothetical protein